MEKVLKSKAYFNQLLDDILRWLASHRSYGVTVTRDEYLEWESKLILASMIIRDLLNGQSGKDKN
jgi:hypothetical protein